MSRVGQLSGNSYTGWNQSFFFYQLSSLNSFTTASFSLLQSCIILPCITVVLGTALLYSNVYFLPSRYYTTLPKLLKSCPPTLKQELNGTLSLPYPQVVNSTTPYVLPSFLLTIKYVPSNAVCPDILNKIVHDFESHSFYISLMNILCKLLAKILNVSPPPLKMSDYSHLLYRWNFNSVSIFVTTNSVQQKIIEHVKQ